ncbi:hypothetical protein LEMLEM_LOCUS16358 [Lemmus lemmus]
MGMGWEGSWEEGVLPIWWIFGGPRTQGHRDAWDFFSTKEPADTQNPVLPVGISRGKTPAEEFSLLKFFFSEEFIGQHFQEVDLDKGDPQPGDLFLFQFQIPVPVPFLAHVGVYCGQGEIIQYEGINGQGLNHGLTCLWPS